MRKVAYTPDIQAFGLICEANYRRVQSLFPLRKASETARVALFHDELEMGQVQATVLGESRYTEDLLLQQVLARGPWLNDPHLQVRLYHDASMAEVVGMPRQHRVEAVNPYPNRKMHLPDEKLQLNRFLSEWLQYCLRHRRKPA